MKTIYHLAISRLKYNKGRSILTIVAIALMTTLLMSIGSSVYTKVVFRFYFFIFVKNYSKT